MEDLAAERFVSNKLEVQIEECESSPWNRYTILKGEQKVIAKYSDKLHSALVWLHLTASRCHSPRILTCENRRGKTDKHEQLCRDIKSFRSKHTRGAMRLQDTKNVLEKRWRHL